MPTAYSEEPESERIQYKVSSADKNSRVDWGSNLWRSTWDEPEVPMLKPGPTKAIFRRPRSNPNELSQELAGSGNIIDNGFLIMFNKKNY